jgi:anthranilate phosphoribosyltransferase
MLTREAIIDLASAKMTDQKAAEHLAALSIDNLTVDIVKDFVSAIRGLTEGSILSSVVSSERLMDCCGTGGSGIPHFNTSTASAFVLASGGVNVAKFGGRSATGLSGSFDFLEALGIATVSDPKALEDIFAKTNIVFLFAPAFYPTFAKLAPVRKKLGVKTIFNIIGPLLNPANPKLRMLGTQRNHVQRLLAQYLSEQPRPQKSCVVSAASGLDELDPNTDNLCLGVANGEIKEEILHHDDMGDSPSSPLTTEQNVEIFFKLIDAFDEAPSYFKRLLALNAGAALQLSGRAASIEEGQILAIELLRSGKVKSKFIQVKNTYAKYSR